MLNKEENQLLAQVGPGTPMGELLRQYWLPAFTSAELPELDGRPLRTKLLGENLVAFRDTNGDVGLVAENCPHRGASLYFGRNEEAGLRCVYHGWKFDASGRCVDMPNEPPESNFKDKVRARAYPCRERNGVVWAYLGPRAEPPPLPDILWNLVPEPQREIFKSLRECNWAQALEGDIDSSHLYFLHTKLDPNDTAAVGVYHEDKRVRMELASTDCGVMYGARRNEGPDQYYWRVSQMLLPIFTAFPSFPGYGDPAHVWVPMDDDHTMQWSIVYSLDRPVTAADHFIIGLSGVETHLPPAGDPLTHWRLTGNRGNDYLRDYEDQRTRTYTGIPSILLQDQAVTESMGRIFDRAQEHLGTTDAMVIQVRRRLIDAAQALRDHGVAPPGVDEPAAYRKRSVGFVLNRDLSWVEGANAANAAVHV